jgi:hypothetical protein
MYILVTVGDMAWIARNLSNMEDSIFGLKLTRHFNRDDRDFDVVDNNNNNSINKEISDMENVFFRFSLNAKFIKKKNCNRLNRNDLIKLLNLITSKLTNDVFPQPLHDVNDKATEEIFTSFLSMKIAMVNHQLFPFPRLLPIQKCCCVHLVVAL